MFAFNIAMQQCPLHYLCKSVLQYRDYHQGLYFISGPRIYYTWCQNEPPFLTLRHSSSYSELNMRDQDAVSSLSWIPVSTIYAFQVLLPSRSNMCIREINWSSFMMKWDADVRWRMRDRSQRYGNVPMVRSNKAGKDENGTSNSELYFFS